MRMPVSKKRTAAGSSTAPKKRKKIQGDEEVFSSEDHTVDATPLHQAEPSQEEGSHNRADHEQDPPDHTAEEEHHSLEKTQSHQHGGSPNHPEKTPPDGN